jgi:hypothetical protein
MMRAASALKTASSAWRTCEDSMMSIDKLTKQQFYDAAGPVVSVEWYLMDCDLPELNWARMRVYANGFADACWEDGGIVYGFIQSNFAGFFLNEDEYRRLSTMDADDEQEFGIRLAEITPPTWSDDVEWFEYLGTY